MNFARPITFLATAAAVFFTAVGIAACGGGGSSSNAPAASKQPAPAVTPKPAAAPKPAPAPKPAKQASRAPAPQASAPSEINGIPQGDVGDNDSDNHGGPDDGDGGI